MKSKSEYKQQVAKVVDAVIAAISEEYGSVLYRKSDGSVGEFTSADDKETLRKELLSYNIADDDKELCPKFASQYYAHKIWTLILGNDYINLAI